MQMSEEIINVFDDLCEKFGVAIDWTNRNIMPYLKEICDKLIRYEIFTSVIWIVISAILITLCIIFSVKTVKSRNEILDGDIKIIVIVALLLTSLLFWAILIIQIFDIAECCIIPEKYLMEYVSNLGRQGLRIFFPNAFLRLTWVSGRIRGKVRSAESGVMWIWTTASRIFPL